LVKNSEIEISRCRAAIELASSRAGPAPDFDFGFGFGAAGAETFGGGAALIAGAVVSNKPSWADRVEMADFLGMRWRIVATTPRRNRADIADDSDNRRTTKRRRRADSALAPTLRKVGSR